MVEIGFSNDPLEAVSCLLRKRSFKIYFENFEINRKLLSQEFILKYQMVIYLFEDFKPGLSLSWRHLGSSLEKDVTFVEANHKDGGGKELRRDNYGESPM